MKVCRLFLACALVASWSIPALGRPKPAVEASSTRSITQESGGEATSYPFGQFTYMGEPLEQKNAKNLVLHPAAGSGKLELLELLYKPGMDIDAPGIASETALHWAAIKGHPSTAKFLLDHGANPNVVDSYERTPLHVAARADHPELITLLLKAGADPMRYHAEGSTPLHMAATRGAASATAAFMGARTNPDLRNLHSGAPPLFDAAWSGSLETVQALLDGGADVTLLDRRGNHVLVPAVAKGNVDIIKALISKGTPIEKRDHEGRTPLHLAVMIGSAKIVTTLLELGASLEAQDNQGNTALHLAVLRRDLPLITMFLARGASLETRSLQGTVRDIARTNNDKELLEILKTSPTSEP